MPVQVCADVVNYVLEGRALLEGAAERRGEKFADAGLGRSRRGILHGKTMLQMYAEPGRGSADDCRLFPRMLSPLLRAMLLRFTTLHHH